MGVNIYQVIHKQQICLGGLASNTGTESEYLYKSAERY